MNIDSLRDFKDKAREPVKTAVPRYGMGYEYHDWICPTCGIRVAYEPDTEGIPKRCKNCGQLFKKLTETN